MMRGSDNRRSKGRRERGSSTVEFALVLPLLFLMCMGATDFGRLFFSAVTVANAAGAGAFYGAQQNIYSGDYSGMETVAKNDAKNIDGFGWSPLSATADRYCDCPAAPADGPGSANAVDCTGGTCPGYGPPRVYVRTRVDHTFKTVGPYPGIPETTQVGRIGYMRVQ